MSLKNLETAVQWYREQYPIGTRVALPHSDPSKPNIVGNIVEVLASEKTGNIVARIEKDDHSFRMAILSK